MSDQCSLPGSGTLKASAICVDDTSDGKSTDGENTDACVDLHAKCAAYATAQAGTYLYGTVRAYYRDIMANLDNLQNISPATKKALYDVHKSMCVAVTEESDCLYNNPTTMVPSSLKIQPSCTRLLRARRSSRRGSSPPTRRPSRPIYL